MNKKQQQLSRKQTTWYKGPQYAKQNKSNQLTFCLIAAPTTELADAIKIFLGVSRYKISISHFLVSNKL